MARKDILIERIKNKQIDFALSLFVTQQARALKALNEYDPKKHDVMNRKEKFIISTSLDDNGNEVSTVNTVYLNKLPIAYQKKIVESAVAFLFGAPVDFNLDQSEELTKNQFFESFKDNVKNLRLNSLNRALARTLFSETEVARLYVPYKSKSGISFKCVNLSNSQGDTLYTMFDDNQSMIAFARQYVTMNEDNTKEVKRVDIYTDDFIYKCSAEGNEYDVQTEINLLNKIPVLYYSQPHTEWEDVDRLIHRLEDLASKRADTNDYTADPILVITGDVKSLPEKDSVGKSVQLEVGASVQYISPEMSIEMVSDERENLKQLINYITSTPDLSLDNMRASIGQMSGKAIQLLFFDATLKALNKQELFGEMLDREVNIIKELMKLQGRASESSSIDDMNIQIKFNSPLPDDLEEYLQTLSVATGGKPLLSQETAVKLNPMVTNGTKEYEQLKSESEADLQNP